MAGSFSPANRGRQFGILIVMIDALKEDNYALSRLHDRISK